MKKLFIYFIFFSLPLTSWGQAQIGMNAGYIYYWFTNPEDGNYDCDYDYSHSAYSFSVFLRQRSSHTFNLGLELAYTNRSFAVKSIEMSHSGSETKDYSYTIGNIYLQFQPQFTFGSKIKIFIYPGLYFGTLLHSSFHGVSKSWYMNQNPTTDTLSGSASDYYPNFEFGILAGAGVDFPINKNLTIIYENNFSMNLLPVANAWGSEKTKLFNLNFKLGLAYTLKKGE